MAKYSYKTQGTCSSQINIEVLEKPLLEFDTHTKVHYKHFERWRLANTLVKLYGKDTGYKYLRNICAIFLAILYSGPSNSFFAFFNSLFKITKTRG